MKNRKRVFWLLGGLAALAMLLLLLSPSAQRLIGTALNVQTTCADIPQIPAQECEALRALYDGTQGANWGNQSNIWFTSATPCDDWFGVECKDTGSGLHITGLHLYSNQLSGSLPDALGNLSSLVTLEASSNQLSGSLPASLAALPGLEVLDVSYNQIAGSLSISATQPVSGTSNSPFSGLKTLRLQSNQFSGSLPANLGDLNNLEELSAQYNQFSGNIPAETGALPKLKKLSLANNQLNGNLPAELGGLSAIEELDLSSNQLSGAIPADLGKLSGLKILYLNQNQFTGSIPTQLSNLNVLLELNLQSNQLSGTIPSELSTLQNLQYLNLASNRLTGGIPTSFSNLTSLQHLIVAGNLLDQELAAELGNLPNLVTLDVSKNALPGQIPSSISNVISAGSGGMDYVSFGYNKLTADDPALVDQLNAKDRNWRTTQTLPPSALTSLQGPNGKIVLIWTPIAYTTDGGYYEVSMATNANGPFTVAGQTADKKANSYEFIGLTLGTTYSFKVRTFTPLHGDQKNELWSDYTSPIISVVAINKNMSDYQHVFLPVVVRR